MTPGTLGRNRACNLLIRSANLVVPQRRRESRFVAFILVDTHVDVVARNELGPLTTPQDATGRHRTPQDAIVGSRVGFLPGSRWSRSAGPWPDKCLSASATHLTCSNVARERPPRLALTPGVSLVLVWGGSNVDGEQDYQFVPRLRSGRHRTAYNVLNCGDGRLGRWPRTANGTVCGTFYRTGSARLPSGMAD